MDSREQLIIEFIKKTGECSSKAVFDGAGVPVSYATLKRMLTDLKANNYLSTKGRGKGTKYQVSPGFEVVQPIDVEKYFQKETDERPAKESFSFQLLSEVLPVFSIFTNAELEKLCGLQKVFQLNIAGLSESAYMKEMERLAIDLSWKSSQIEGNTYSLLETERLLKEKETAAGKTKEEAIMLLNHKDAIDFILENKDYLHILTVSKIEDIHAILTKELNVDRNLRNRRVGITGTNYRPLDNEFQILEALRDTCELINQKESVFEKALLALVLISYIQPFMDGNKRTARIVSNAILMANGYCPLSFRTVDSLDYKKAMLLFYEQNNISTFKGIFVSQFEFAVSTYF
jgi:Fic family protein